MPRSTKKSITVPNPVREGLVAQIKGDILDYPSENAAWIGLARYQLLIGKPHPVTTAISRMHAEDQDVIDDFLLEIATRGLTLRGQFLSHLIRCEERSDFRSKRAVWNSAVEPERLLQGPSKIGPSCLSIGAILPVFILADSSDVHAAARIRQAIDGSSDPTEQEVEGLVPQELLRMAKDWKRAPEKVLAGLRK